MKVLEVISSSIKSCNVVGQLKPHDVKPRCENRVQAHLNELKLPLETFYVDRAFHCAFTHISVTISIDLVAVQYCSRIAACKPEIFAKTHDV